MTRVVRRDLSRFTRTRHEIRTVHPSCSENGPAGTQTPQRGCGDDRRVEYHPGRPGQEPGYTLEVFNAVGETVAVVTVRQSQIEPLKSNEVLHVRPLVAAA